MIESERASGTDERLGRTMTRLGYGGMKDQLEASYGLKVEQNDINSAFMNHQRQVSWYLGPYKS